MTGRPRRVNWTKRRAPLHQRRVPGRRNRADKTVACPMKRTMLADGELVNSTTMALSNEPVTIKRYAHRRLYDTGTGAYVTLEDLAFMVEDEREFAVVDAATGADITRSVLQQIIRERARHD